jgi:hypothetical protein
MKNIIPVYEFDLPCLIDTLTAFWGDHESAFPLVANGFADFGTFGLGDEADPVGETPLEWLQHGQTLFAQFTKGDGTSYALADGSELEVTDDDEAEGSFLDDCSTYGWLISLKDGLLTLETAVLRDVTGECRVEAVDHAGVFTAPMKAFLQSLTRK